MLTRDPQFGYFSTYQTLIPSIFISGEKMFKPVVIKSLPNKRPMDDGDLSADLPQEDIYALGALSPYSYYHGWVFPQNMRHYDDYICMDHATPQTINDWKSAYLTLLKKSTMYHHGKQLILKNQDNTGKIPQLLDMFPDAKFIYCYRNPYDLYMSMKKFMTRVIALYCVQTPPPWDEMETEMMRLFTDMTNKYLHDKHLIPKDNLIEVRYETLLKQPQATIKDIYTTFNLPGYSQAEPLLKAYIDGQKTIKTDHYTYSDVVKKQVKDKWGFALQEYHYTAPMSE